MVGKLPFAHRFVERARNGEFIVHQQRDRGRTPQFHSCKVVFNIDRFVQEKLGVGDGDQVSVTWDLADGEHPKKYAEWADSSKQKLLVRCSSRIQRNIGMDSF
jgi:hypothetical protein